MGPTTTGERRPVMAGTDFNELLGAETRVEGSGINSTLLRGISQLPSERISLTSDFVQDFAPPATINLSSVPTEYSNGTTIFRFTVSLPVAAKVIIFGSLTGKQNTATGDANFSIYEVLPTGSVSQLTGATRFSGSSKDGVNVQNTTGTALRIVSLDVGDHILSLRYRGTAATTATLVDAAFGYIVIGQ
jgi:hypothetical protein